MYRAEKGDRFFGKVIMKTVKHNLHQLLIALDQLANVLLCSVCLPHEKSWGDETLSSRAWRWHIAGIRSWPKKAIEGVFFWEKDHCREAFESERLGRQLPPEARPVNILDKQ